MVLITALLMLVVMTILGMGMFRSFGMTELMAGNTRERERALQAANTSLDYAEWWLTGNSGANATSGVNCTTITTLPTPPQVCSNVLVNPGSNLPWTVGGNYTPPTMNVTTTTAANTYFNATQYYISFLSSPPYDPSTGTQLSYYQIDAAGYGGTAAAAAVLESGYVVAVTHTTYAQQPNAQGKMVSYKFVNLGGP
jgi:type IV pilus assembly protein PilX